MTTTMGAELYWDPYDEAIFNDPYPVYRRMRDEAPLYFNQPHDFYAVSRFEDVEHVLINRETFVSNRGDILAMIQAGIEIPSGTLIYDEPPVHGIHRALLSRVFTPKRMYELEPTIRAFCASELDELVERDSFDFVVDIGARVPMRVIGMLLGLPEADQESLRDYFEAGMRGEVGKPMDFSGGMPDGEIFAEYVDWRYDNPTDDLMSVLIHTEFEDADGTTRTLTRSEVLSYLTVLAGAGNETANRLIGWTGMLLGENHDARREIAADRSLVPNAVEEVLRFETISQYVARYVASEVEMHGQTIPAGSTMVALPGSGNRDERRFPDPDRFDIHRTIQHHLGFGYGAHFCLGAALARVEARVVLDEVLNRFPDWEFDRQNADLRPGTNRGWDHVPVIVS